MCSQGLWQCDRHHDTPKELCQPLTHGGALAERTQCVLACMVVIDECFLSPWWFGGGMLDNREPKV